MKNIIAEILKDENLKKEFSPGQDSAYVELMQQALAFEDQLLERLPDDEKLLFLRWQNTYMKMVEIEKQALFTTGYRLGSGLENTP